MPDPNPTSAAPALKPRSRPGPVRWAFAIVLLAVAGWAGWHTYRVFQQRDVAEHVEELGGVVTYDFDYTDPTNRADRPSGPNPIASVLGNDYTQDIVQINLRSSDRRNLTDEDLEKVTSLSELRELSISNGAEITDEGLDLLARMPKLQRLTMTNFPNVTDAGLAVLSRLPELRRLELVAMPKITDEALEHLAELEDFRELSISNCKIDGSGWQYLNAPGLLVLETTLCQVRDESLKHVANASALEELSVTQNQIKGAGLSHLKGLSKLIRLRLGENPLDPAAAVSNLKELTSLELLNLKDTPLDRQAGQELAKALPKCDITITDGYYNPEDGKWDFEAASKE